MWWMEVIRFQNKNIARNKVAKGSFILKPMEKFHTSNMLSKSFLLWEIPIYILVVSQGVTALKEDLISWNRQIGSTLSSHISENEKCIGCPIYGKDFFMYQEFPFTYSICSRKWFTIGSDSHIIKILANKLGATSCLDSSLFKNSDPYLILSNRIANVAGISNVIPPYRLPGVRFFYPHLQSDMCILVPYISPKWRGLMSSFSLEVWITLCITLFLSAVTLHFYHHPFPVFQVITTIVSGQFPTNHQSNIVKIFFVLLSFSAVILISAFSGCITSIRSVVKEVAQIDTLQEASEAVEKILVDSSILNYFHFVDRNDIVWTLLNKRIDRKMEREGQKYEKVGIIAPRVIIEVNIKSEPLRSERPYLTHIVKECLMSPSYSAFMGRSDWPLFEKFNHMLMILTDTGIVGKLQRENVNEWRRHGVKIYHDHELETTYTPTPLDLRAINEPLVLLLAGLALASLVFVAEGVSNLSAFQGLMNTVLHCLSHGKEK